MERNKINNEESNDQVRTEISIGEAIAILQRLMGEVSTTGANTDEMNDLAVEIKKLEAGEYSPQRALELVTKIQESIDNRSSGYR